MIFLASWKLDLEYRLLQLLMSVTAIGLVE
nr:MAG TPA: hypothetical protein [Caudoviricetes sp.]